MSWIRKASKWHTLFALNEDHDVLGFKGWVFFISDFTRDLKTSDLKCIINNPTFTGLGVGTGISSFVLSDTEILELFTPIEKTFDEYAQELEANYYREA